MFNYLSSITELAHHIVKCYSKEFNVAVDATLGNGGDCDFLSSCFNRVYAFDIQSIAIEQYERNKLENVILINDSHSNMESYIKEEVDIVMFNLGFLPGGDKGITTMAESSLEAIDQSLKLLRCGGMVLIAVYVGHEEGAKESESIIEYVKKLPRDRFGVMLHKVLNRSEKAPYLLVVEKK